MAKIPTITKCPKCGQTVMPGSDNPKGWCYLHIPVKQTRVTVDEIFANPKGWMK